MTSPVSGPAAVTPAGDEALRACLDAGLARIAPGLDDPARATLLAYVGLLERWNRAYSLTAVREPRAMIERHVLDSLAVLPYLHGARALDVGSGAGLPGLVLAVARPEPAWVLLDSKAKKHRFLTQACLELGLGNVEPVRSRLEDFHPATPFSTIISRAFAGTAELLAKTRRMLEPGGRLLAMKGRFPERELAELEAAGAGGEQRESVEVVPLSIPGLEHEERHLVVVTVGQP
ncbi:MAG: 16S rRNA (guanine(527)-N(7))-methyltransferase RsmG [Gammaproteobacteria bacterium]|nr:16S rRNA (guanine(527)-N(7))-methyltransferase RsmG [Gammaproteobacteria bacterium]